MLGYAEGSVFAALAGSTLKLTNTQPPHAEYVFTKVSGGKSLKIGYGWAYATVRWDRKAENCSCPDGTK